jgi:2-oxoglutarate ferredoxin oxidoreductase subunit beta
MEQGKPLVYGLDNDKGILLDGLTPRIVNTNNVSLNDLWIHDEKDGTKAYLLSKFFEDPSADKAFPRPFGVFYTKDTSCYEDDLIAQINEVTNLKGHGDLNKLISGKDTWEII